MYRCIKQGKVPGKPYKHLTYYECECADGYTGDHHLQPPFFVIYFNPFLGNGIQCMDANGTWAVSGDAFVELEMTLTSEVRNIMMRMIDREIVSRLRPSPLTLALTCPLEWSYRT